MTRRRIASWREALAFFVVLVVAITVSDAVREHFGDRALWAACVAIGGVAGALLWYRRGAAAQRDASG